MDLLTSKDPVSLWNNRLQSEPEKSVDFSEKPMDSLWTREAHGQAPDPAEFFCCRVTVSLWFIVLAFHSQRTQTPWWHFVWREDKRQSQSSIYLKRKASKGEGFPAAQDVLFTLVALLGGTSGFSQTISQNQPPNGPSHGGTVPRLSSRFRLPWNWASCRGPWVSFPIWPISVCRRHSITLDSWKGRG